MESLIHMAITDEMFTESAKPFTETAAAISQASGSMTMESAYRRMKTARLDAPRPPDWERSRWRAQVQPLFVDHFVGGATSSVAKNANP